MPTGPIIPIDGDARRKLVTGVISGLSVSWWLDQTSIPRLIAEWVLRNIVDPVVGSVQFVGEAIIGLILTIVFGQDRAFGPPEYGIADLPLWIIPVLEDTGELFGSMLGVIEEFNQGLADIAATGGVAAPAIVTALYIAEVTVVLWVLWSVIRVIDFPLISLDGLLQVLTAPLQFIVRRLR